MYKKKQRLKSYSYKRKIDVIINVNLKNTFFQDVLDSSN